MTGSLRTSGRGPTGKAYVRRRGLHGFDSLARLVVNCAGFLPRRWNMRGPAGRSPHDGHRAVPGNDHRRSLGSRVAPISASTEVRWAGPDRAAPSAAREVLTRPSTSAESTLGATPLATTIVALFAGPPPSSFHRRSRCGFHNKSSGRERPPSGRRNGVRRGHRGRSRPVCCTSSGIVGRHRAPPFTAKFSATCADNRPSRNELDVLHTSVWPRICGPDEISG